MKHHIERFIVRPFILLIVLFGLMANAYGEPGDYTYFDAVEDVVDASGTTVGGVGPGELVDLFDGPEDGMSNILLEYWPIVMGKVKTALESVPGGSIVWEKIETVLGSSHLDDALKALEVIGHVSDFAFVAYDIYDAFVSDDQDGFEDAVFDLSEMIVVKLGEWAGGHFGPSIGQAIGTALWPGVGTVIGWIGGTVWGDDVGGKLGEWLVGFFEDDIKDLAGRLYTRLKDGGGDDGGGGLGPGGNSLNIPINPTAGAADYVRPFIYSGPGGYYGPGGAGINGGNGHPTANAVGGNSPGINREQPIEDLGE